MRNGDHSTKGEKLNLLIETYPGNNSELQKGNIAVQALTFSTST